MKTLLSRSLAAVTAAAALVLAPAVTGAATVYATEGGGLTPTFFDTCRGPAQLKIPAGGTFTKDGQGIAAGLHDVAEGESVTISDGSRNWSFTNDAAACPSAATVFADALDNHAGSVLSAALHSYSAQVHAGSGGGDPGAAANALDGSNISYWHTPYRGLTPRERRLPHWIAVDLGETARVDFVEVMARETQAGHPREVSVLASDDGVSFEVVADAVLPTGAGSPQKSATIQIPQTSKRYFALLAHSAHGTASHLNIAEIRFGNAVATAVTPASPKFINLAGSNIIEIPRMDGINYSFDGQVKAPGRYTVTENKEVTASAKGAFTIAADAAASWTSQFSTATCVAGQTQQGAGVKLNLNATVRDWDTESFDGRGGEPDAKAIYAVDGDYDTLWHTPWKRAGGVPDSEIAMPHFLEIDLGADHAAVRAIKYFHRARRPGTADKFNGQMKTVELLSSADGYVFNSVGCFSLPDVRTEAHPAQVLLNLPQDLSDRYIRLHITEAWVGATAPATGTNYVTVNELEFYAENRAPEITAEGTTVRTGGEVNIPVTATDPDQQTVTVTLQGAPDGLEYADGAITGRAPLEARAYPFTIVARDEYGKETTKEITLTVTPNAAPTLSLAAESVTVVEGQPVSVVATVQDSDGDEVALSLEDNPQWLSLSDKTVVGTPTAAEAAPVVVKVKASDGRGGEAVKTLTITVNSNRAPAVEAESASVRGGAQVEIPVRVTDADGHTFEVAVDGLPAGLSYGANKISGTAPAEAGQHQLTIRATDQYGRWVPSRSP